MHDHDGGTEKKKDELYLKLTQENKELKELSDCPNILTDWMTGNRMGPCEDCGHPKNKHPRQQQGKFCQVTIKLNGCFIFVLVAVISYIVAVISCHVIHGLPSIHGSYIYSAWE